MIPGSKGQKFDANLLAEEILTPTSNHSRERCFVQELRKIINQTDFNKGEKYKKFYIWSTHRLLSVQLLNIAALLVISYLGYQIFHFWMIIEILMYKDICGLIIVCFYLFWLLPRVRFFLSRKKSPKVFGNTYELIITKDGYHVNHKSFSWKGKKIVTCKRGIAVLSFWNILLLLPIDAFSKEEYTTLKTWIKK